MGCYNCNFYCAIEVYSIDISLHTKVLTMLILEEKPHNGYQVLRRIMDNIKWLITYYKLFRAHVLHYI